MFLKLFLDLTHELIQSILKTKRNTKSVHLCTGHKSGSTKRPTQGLLLENSPPHSQTSTPICF